MQVCLCLPADGRGCATEFNLLHAFAFTYPEADGNIQSALQTGRAVDALLDRRIILITRGSLVPLFPQLLPTCERASIETLDERCAARSSRYMLRR